MKKYRRAIALFLASGLMVLIPSGMGVSASGNTVEAKMSENIAQVLSMTGIEREEYSDQQVIDVDGQRVRQLVFDDNLKVDMDGANVKAISHFTACTNDAIVVYGEDDISETVNNIVEISDMDENYDLVGSEEFDDDYWRLTWVKSYGSIQNPYESVNAVVNRRTRELTTYRRFDEVPNTITPGITQSEAFERLTQLDTVEWLNLSNAECELTFTKRNYLRDENSTTRHYGEVRMAYHFTIGNYSVYIDAVTGEDIAYSEKRMVARAFSADGEGAFPNPQKQTADATTCFNELGYTTYEPCISAQYYLRQSLDAFIDDDNAYGLYLACHGDEDQTVLSGLGWTMGRDDIHGNWRFVFLDACYSAAGTGWSNQFNIYSYSQSRAFLGWSDTVEGGNSTDFSSAFFPEVIAGNHSNNIRDAAVWAADQVPGHHTAPIKFIGDRTYRGFV